MISDTINVSVSSTDGGRISGSSTETGTTHVSVDTNLPSASTNVLVAAAWTVANTQALFLVSSADCTIKTNSSGSPADTINLKAGIPLLWRASPGYYANPFGTNVTAWYVTCSQATRLQALILTT
jgi:hypothetical protein